MPSTTSTFIHLLGFVHHSMVLRGFGDIDLDSHSHPIVEGLKPYRFLTISGWCFAFQLMHIVLSLITEWQHWRGVKGNKKILQKYTRIKDLFFRGIVFPTNMQVSLLFWSLFLYDRELVYPRIWDSVVPPWMNHGVHTTTLLLAVAELVMDRKSKVEEVEAKVYWGLSVGYALLLDLVYLYSGVWFYPFLGYLSWPLLLVFQAAFCLGGRVLVALVGRIDQRGRQKAL